MKELKRLLAWLASYSLIEIAIVVALAPLAILLMAGGPWFAWLFATLFSVLGLLIAAVALHSLAQDTTEEDGKRLLPKWARLNPRACKKSQDERYTAPGRSAADGRLANPVRSGRKQP